MHMLYDVVLHFSYNKILKSHNISLTYSIAEYLYLLGCAQDVPGEAGVVPKGLQAHLAQDEGVQATSLTTK